MSDWPLVSIDEIKADSKGSIAIGPFGSRMKSDCYVEEGIPVIRGTNITGGPTFAGVFVYITEEKADTLGSSNVYKDDLVFPHRGSIGEVGIVLKDERYVLSSSLMKLTCDRTRVNPKFLYCFFKSRLGRHELLKNASQVGTPGIGQPLTSLKSIELRLPPLNIQDNIENVITSLDDKIELNRQTNQTLDQIAQTIFKSWFVDFEPTRAKLKAKQTGQDPERAAIAAISGKTLVELDQLTQEQMEQHKTTAALFPDALVDSELGEIPEGWEVKLNGDVMDVRDGTHDSPKQSEEGYPLVTSKHITTGVLKIRDAYLISAEDFRKVNKRSQVNQHDILLTMIGTVGISYLVLQPDVNFAIKNVGLFRTSEIKELKNYFYLLLKSPEMKTYLEARMAGTTQKYLSLKTLRSIEMLEPSAHLLAAFNEAVNPIMDSIHSHLLEIEELSELRDTLLPKLLNGDVEIGMAQGNSG